VGLVNYYRMAYNLHALNKLRWVMERSLLKTLASKLKISMAKVAVKYQTTTKTKQGQRRVLQVTVEREGKEPLVAQWGGISLVHSITTPIKETMQWTWPGRTELEKRLLADTCELCGAHEDVEVHHIRALKDLHPKGRREKPQWMLTMASRQRKTLVCCRACHMAIHYPQRKARKQA
jgi:hypothetical protein